jgi:ABC-type glycerol-3-phosphate transport system substrate-binding protein
MSIPLRRKILISCLAVSTVVALAGCGAGSKTAEKTATKVACDFTNPPAATTINVLAYNSSAVDPFTNTMVSSCTHDNVTVKHDPIDFPGQVQKTTATLSSDTGSYDILETYSFVIPDFGSKQKLVPLDDLLAKYSAEYKLDALDPAMVQTMSYQGKLYGLPMQAQTHVMAYRKDLFDKNGITPPTTFEEMKAAAKKLQSAEGMKYPIALPWLATGDIGTAYRSALSSLGKFYVDPDSKKANFETPEAGKAFEEMKGLLPYMDPQVTTFDQPKVQQQLYNGSAAMGIMFSGRMIDLTKTDNTKFASSFAFAPPPAVEKGGKTFGSLSVDGWSIPFNTKVDKDLLFETIAASVSEDASKASIPAAYPARKGLDQSASPYAKAADDAIANLNEQEVQPWLPPINNATLPIITEVVSGKISVEEGQKKMQAAAEKVLTDFA